MSASISTDIDMVRVIAIAVYAIVAITFGTLCLRPAYLYARKRYHDLHEADRFSRDPRVGDLAGYEILPTMWRVGRVIYVGSVGTDTREVRMETQVSTALGTQTMVRTRELQELRWFPPDTPLGINIVESERSRHRA